MLFVSITLLTWITATTPSIPTGASLLIVIPQRHLTAALGDYSFSAVSTSYFENPPSNSLLMRFAERHVHAGPCHNSRLSATACRRAGRTNPLVVSRAAGGRRHSI